MNREEKKEKFIELSELIKKTGNAYGNMLLSSKSDSEIDEISRLESKGDEIQELLDKDFASQKNIPYLAIDRAKLLRRIDGTLDEFKLATQTYNLYRNSLPADFTENIKELSENITIISSKLSNAIELIYSSFDDSLRVVESIEDLRDNTQSISFNILSNYFTKLDEASGWKQYQAVSNILKHTMTCITAIKGTSEILTLMAYKYD